MGMWGSQKGAGPGGGGNDPGGPGGGGGGGSVELPPRTGVPNGAILQKLANGVRWVDELDGGNAAGAVTYPAWGFPAQPSGGGDAWTPGQTNFVFGSGAFTPSTNFTF